MERSQTYDFLLTLSEEVELVWKRKRDGWSIPVAVFLIIRYLPFVDSFLALYRKRSLTSMPSQNTNVGQLPWELKARGERNPNY
jgi:hypothetical protein